MTTAYEVVLKVKKHISGTGDQIVIDQNDVFVDEADYAAVRIDEVTATVGVQVLGNDCYIECKLALLTPHDPRSECVISHSFVGRDAESSEVYFISTATMEMYPRLPLAVAFADRLCPYADAFLDFDAMSYLNERDFWVRKDSNETA